MAEQVSRRTVLAALAIIPVAAACGQAATPASSPTAGSAPASQPRGSSAASPSASASSQASGQGLETLKVSFASNSAIYAPFFIAMDKGYYAADGIAINMVEAGGGVATPALISGDVAYSTSAASSISAIIKGAPLKVIETTADRPGYELWTSSPNVKTLADVKGKTIGIQTRGDTFEIAMRIFLEKHNMDPNSVSFTPLGTGNARLSALQSGSIPVVLLGTGDVVQYQSTGGKGHMVANLKQEVQMLYTGVATSDKELKDHPDRVQRYLRATMKGLLYYIAFKDQTLQILGKYNKRVLAANDADYQDVLSSLTPDGSMPADIQQADTKVRAQILGVTSPPSVDKLYDYGPVKAVFADLKASGWQPQP